jgi:hypothetical protein
MLKRYWFTFGEKKRADDLSVLSAGCGVTAYDLNDAKKILEDLVFPLYGDRDIASIQENVDVATLDRNHVQLNMGAPSNRGVWFPLI